MIQKGGVRPAGPTSRLGSVFRTARYAATAIAAATAATPKLPANTAITIMIGAVRSKHTPTSTHPAGARISEASALTRHFFVEGLNVNWIRNVDIQQSGAGIGAPLSVRLGSLNNLSAWRANGPEMPVEELRGDGFVAPQALGSPIDPRCTLHAASP